MQQISDHLKVCSIYWRLTTRKTGQHFEIFQSRVHLQPYYLNTYLKFVTRVERNRTSLSSCIINEQISCKRFTQQMHFYVFKKTAPVKTHDIPPSILWHVFPPMTNKMGEIQLREASVSFVWLMDCQWLLPVHPAEVWSTSLCSSKISCHRQLTVKTWAVLKGPRVMMKLHFPKKLIKTPLCLQMLKVRCWSSSSGSDQWYSPKSKYAIICGVYV